MSVSRLPQVTLSPSGLSDIFFNFQKTNLQGYLNSVEDADVTSEEGRAALLLDAEMFATMTDDQVTAEQLVEDYYSRL